jgi:predicted ATP-grasp superfamily ATP-dependent carboligase
VVLLHHDPRDMAQLSKFVTEAIRVPHPEREPDAFLQRLLALAERYAGAVLIPTSDEALVCLARNRDQLAEHYCAAFPDWEVVHTCIDKQLTAGLAAGCGVPAPRTVVPKSRREAVELAGEVDYPCLVKPCQSHLFYDHFGVKMFRVDDADALLWRYDQARDADLEVMIQEIIPGPDVAVVNYNAYAWEGEVLADFTAEHTRNAPPHWGSPRVVKSRALPELRDPGRALLRALRYSGFACTEFKRDERDGVYKLVEINARHNLSTQLAVSCGINFPWIEYRKLTSGEDPTPEASELGRYWIDIPRDLGYSLLSRRIERYSLWEYLQPYCSRNCFAILDWRDPRPILYRFAFLMKEGLVELSRRLRKVGRRRSRSDAARRGSAVDAPVANAVRATGEPDA